MMGKLVFIDRKGSVKQGGAVLICHANFCERQKRLVWLACVALPVMTTLQYGVHLQACVPACCWLTLPCFAVHLVLSQRACCCQVLSGLAAMSDGELEAAARADKRSPDVLAGYVAVRKQALSCCLQVRSGTRSALA